MTYSTRARFISVLTVSVLGLLTLAMRQSPGKSAVSDAAVGPQSESISSKAQTLSTIAGQVTSIEGDMLEIAGAVQVDISQARLRSMVGQEPLPASSIAIGTNIEASVATVSEDPTRPSLAEDVFVQLPTGGTIYGPLQAVNLKAKTVKLFNTTVQITSQTAMPSFGGVLVLNQFKIGEPLEVSFQNTGSGLIGTQVRSFSR